MPYEVHLEVYDGPFDLLLKLITSDEVDVYEVRLADIVDVFCAELERAERLDLELATEFLLIAATLVELKCRRLLPGSDDVELDEELSLFEARDYLLARLVENRTFQQASAALVAAEHAASRSHPRSSGADERFDGLEPDLLFGVTPAMLLQRAIRALAGRAVPVVDTSHVHVDEVSVADTLQDLATRLPTIGTSTLRELCGPGARPVAVVATFLALLELYKRALIDLDQVDSFGELSVRWIGSGPSEGAGAGQRSAALGEDGRLVDGTVSW